MTWSWLTWSMQAHQRRSRANPRFGRRNVEVGFGKRMGTVHHPQARAAAILPHGQVEQRVVELDDTRCGAAFPTHQK